MIINPRDRPQRLSNIRAMAARYVPSVELVTAINTALSNDQPLLLTGDPGTGRSMVAFFVALELGILDKVYHFVAFEDSSAQELIYSFDEKRYLLALKSHGKHIDRRDYISRGVFWRAFEVERAVVLIEGMNTTSDRFQTALLEFLDRLEFTVPEIDLVIRSDHHKPPVVLFSADTEEGFSADVLRRCVFHHLEITKNLLRHILNEYRNEYPSLTDDVLDVAIARFMEIRELKLRKRPSPSELMDWLRALDIQELSRKKFGYLPLHQLPSLGVLLKYEEDLRTLSTLPEEASAPDRHLDMQPMSEVPSAKLLAPHDAPSASMSPPEAFDVFISYAREDEEAAERIVQRFNSRGIRAWYDRAAILPGQNWQRTIKQAVKRCSIFLALMSSRSVNKRGFVQKEIRLALDVLDEFPPDSVYLIPARLDDCQPVHDKLREIQWVDLFPNFDRGFERILDALQAMGVEGNKAAPAGLRRLLGNWVR